MKRLVPLLAAAAVGAAVLLRPVPPPTAAATGWSSAPPAGAGRRGARTPPPQALVYVAGDVVRPGVYPVRPDARARDALALAGGPRPGADLVAVNLAAHLRDGDEIVVPARGEAKPRGTSGGTGRGRGHRAGSRGSRGSGDRTRGVETLPSAGGPPDAESRHRRRHGRAGRGAAPPALEIDINTAAADELATIPGIGDGLALRIVAFRRENGPFASVDELLDVAGITEHRLDAIIPFVVAR